MNQLINKLTNTVHRFTIIDIAIFKLYLIAVSLLASFVFPILLTVSWIIYTIIAVCCIGLFTWILSKKEENFYKKTVMQGWNIHIFRKITTIELAVFKIGIIAVGLGVASLFPLVLTAPFAWYIGVFAFGFGYFISVFSHKK